MLKYLGSHLIIEWPSINILLTFVGQCSTCYKPDQTIYIDNAYPKWATLAADQQTVSVQNTAFNFQIVE